MKKQIISAILTASILISSQSIFTEIPKVNAEETIKIMSVGDSITDGYWESGSYRKYMYHALEENGITNIDMVGAKGMNEETYSDNNTSFTYDGNYSGYSGYAIQYITGTETRQGILETMQSETYGDNNNQNMMEAYQPDIVLLQIGTNDILSAYNDGITDRLENLCDYILSYLNEDDTLFVSTIPDIDVETVYTWFWAYGDEYYGVEPEVFYEKVQNYVDTYNQTIEDMVARKQSEGVVNIQFADINSVVDYQTDLYDGIHPNEQGYQKMGEYWCGVLTNYLKGETPVVTTTTEDITTTTPLETTTTEDITTTTPLETTTTEDITTTTPWETTTTEDITTTTPLETTTSTDITTTTTELPIVEYQIGDLNNDGNITYLDLLILKKRVMGNILNWVEYHYDINQDGDINVMDVVELKSIILGEE